MRPRVLVSVLHWCDAAQTAACVAALQRAALQAVAVEVDLLLIDNAAVDGSGAGLVDRYPELHHAVATENLGYAGGHALALPVAADLGADALLLVNSDVQVGEGTIAALVAAWQHGGSALYLAAESATGDAEPGRLRFPSRLLDPAAGPHAWFGPRSGEIPWPGTAAPIRVATAFGSVVLIPQELIARHGFLDPRWFLYGEELDYGFRLRAAGVPTFLVPTAVVRHAGGGSSRARPAVAAQLAYYRCRNELELAWRYSPWPLHCWIVAKKLAAATAATLGRRPQARWLWRGLVDGLRRRRGKTYRPEDAWHEA